MQKEKTIQFGFGNMSKPKKHKGYYWKDGKKVSTKQKHSETYNNETYKYVKEGGYFGATLVMPNVPRHAQVTMQYAF